MNIRNKRDAFTLIELLMVVVVVGVLASILIPTAGVVHKQATVAASKAQLSNYVNAIQLFKGEYGFYPFAPLADPDDPDSTAPSDSYSFSLNGNAGSTEFIQTLSGRNPDGTLISTEDARSTGNRRRITFHSFSESGFWVADDDSVSGSQIADRFNNINIVIEIDSDGDGFVAPASAQGTRIRSPVTAYVNADHAIGAPAYNLWD